MVEKKNLWLLLGAAHRKLCGSSPATSLCFLLGETSQFCGFSEANKTKAVSFFVVCFFLLFHCGDGTSFWIRAEERIEKTENLQERTSFFYYYYLSCSTVPVKVA